MDSQLKKLYNEYFRFRLSKMVRTVFENMYGVILVTRMQFNWILNLQENFYTWYTRREKYVSTIKKRVYISLCVQILTQILKCLTTLRYE